MCCVFRIRIWHIISIVAVKDGFSIVAVLFECFFLVVFRFVVAIIVFIYFRFTYLTTYLFILCVYK